MSLPKTVHPLSDPEKFVFDTWTMPGFLAPAAPGVPGETIIYAVVHGQYMECELVPSRILSQILTGMSSAEQGNQIVRQDLHPRPLSTRLSVRPSNLLALDSLLTVLLNSAQLAGWPCIILSDILTVRGYSDPSVWTPKPVPPPAAPAAPVAGPSTISAPVVEGLVRTSAPASST